MNPYIYIILLYRKKCKHFFKINTKSMFGAVSRAVIHKRYVYENMSFHTESTPVFDKSKAVRFYIPGQFMYKIRQVAYCPLEIIYVL